MLVSKVKPRTEKHNAMHWFVLLPWLIWHCCLLPSAACCPRLPASPSPPRACFQQKSTRFILPVVRCLSQRLSHAQTHCKCNGSFSALGCCGSPLLRGMRRTCDSGGSQGTCRDMELAILMDYWGPAWTCGTRDSSKR